MPASGGAYGKGGLGGEVATELKRKPSMTVSYVNTKRQPGGTKALQGKFAHVKPLPKP